MWSGTMCDDKIAESLTFMLNEKEQERRRRRRIKIIVIYDISRFAMVAVKEQFHSW